jgi:hypothetical protein
LIQFGAYNARKILDLSAVLRPDHSLTCPALSESTFNTSIWLSVDQVILSLNLHRMEENLANASTLPEIQTTRPASEEADVYRPLNENTREIRLAHILPTQHEEVQVELQVVSLDDSPVYEALSYVWGDPGITKPIIVNGRQMNVTVSLEAAFRKFRQQADGAVVVIWADAICINQKDIQERGQQVSIMADIYRCASR